MSVSFDAHTALLTHFLDRRALVADAIERQLLNVQHKHASRSGNRDAFEARLAACFFDASAVPRSLFALQGQLAAAHRADGFEPAHREASVPHLDPVELMLRAYDYWDSTRWPGRNGRLTFAQTIYAVFVLGRLEQLSLRVWDEGDTRAEERLSQVQQLLDRLNDDSGPVFVRDARWLIQTAQGPLTRELAAYFTIAGRIASFDAPYRIEVHKAGVLLAGGHLRSQQRYRAAEIGRAYDDEEVLAITRNSNSMDAALLAGDLVALLEAYDAVRDVNQDDRRALADAIVQGLTADPELFVTGLDLLTPATLIEHVFVGAADGRLEWTAAGARHMALLARYRSLIDRLAPSLVEDLPGLDPAGRAYSPLGIAYGFCADLLWNIAVSTLTPAARSDLALEDVFGSSRLDENLARARAWQTLPVRPGEHEHFTCSPEWAQQVFEGVASRLRQRAGGVATGPTGRLFVVVERRNGETRHAGDVPETAVSGQEHYVTSDIQRALANGATAFPKSHIVADRKEGRYLGSVEQDGKWFAVSKVLLTQSLAAGRDAVITDVPLALADLVRFTCGELVVAV